MRCKVKLGGHFLHFEVMYFAFQIIERGLCHTGHGVRRLYYHHLENSSKLSFSCWNITEYYG